MYVNFAVGERTYFDLAKLGIELLCNRFRKVGIGVTAKQLDFIAVSYHM